MSNVSGEYIFQDWDDEQTKIDELNELDENDDELDENDDEVIENLMKIKHILEVGKARALHEQHLGEGKTSDDEEGTTTYLDFLAKKIIYYNEYLTQINESINRFKSKGGGEHKKKTRKKRQLTSNYILMDITLIRKNIISILNDDLIDKLKIDGTMRPDADLNSKKVKEIVKNLKINDIDFLVNKWYNEHYPETSSIKTKNKIGGNGDDICAICHENLDIGETRTLVGCRHIFHNDCIGMWFETSRTCPICRTFEPIRMRERLAIFIRTTLVNNFFLRIVRNEEPLRQLAIELDYNFIATHFISVGIILPYTGRNYPAQIPHSDWRTSTEIFIGSFGSAALITGGLLLWARMYPRQDDPPDDPPNEPPHQEGGRRKKKTRKKKTRKKKRGRRKTRKKKTRKKRGGQEIQVGQEWKIKNDERLAQAFGNNPVFRFIKIIEEAETPLGGPGKRWKVSPSATINFSSNTLDMYEFAIRKNYYILYEEEEPPATEDEDEEWEVMDYLKGGRRKKRGGSLICKPKKNDDGTDMTYDNNGEPAIGLVLGEKYRFLCADTHLYIGTLVEIDGGGGREHKLLVQGFDERKWRYDLEVMNSWLNPFFRGNREERLRKNIMIPCSEEDHPWTGKTVRADGAGGGKRRKKSKRNTRKKKGGGQPTIKDIKYGSAWVHQDTKKRYKISNPYPDLEYKDGGFIVLVRDPEYDPNDKNIYKYKNSKDLFQNFALAREVWDGGGEGGGGAAASGGRKKKTRKRRKKKTRKKRKKKTRRKRKKKTRKRRRKKAGMPKLTRTKSVSKNLSNYKGPIKTNPKENLYKQAIKKAAEEEAKEAGVNQITEAMKKL